MFTSHAKAYSVRWLLGAAVLAVPLALALRAPRGPGPGAAEEDAPVADVPSDFGPRDLLRCLAARGLRLHLTPGSTTGDLWAGFYLSERPRDRDSLLVLCCSRHAIDRWEGVVNVVYLGHLEAVPDDWGACGLRAGQLLLFGDPQLLTRIREAIEQ
jgi:hypothetical protein